VREVWLHGSARNDTVVDIASTLAVKIRALREHKSQMGDWDPTAMITAWAREQGRRKRLRAAESFRRMILENGEEEA
jgi:LmbE family N-acetylglucosaminyl deacetylase